MPISNSKSLSKRVASRRTRAAIASHATPVPLLSRTRPRRKAAPKPGTFTEERLYDFKQMYRRDRAMARRSHGRRALHRRPFAPLRDGASSLAESMVPPPPVAPAPATDPVPRRHVSERSSPKPRAPSSVPSYRMRSNPPAAPAAYSSDRNSVANMTGSRQPSLSYLDALRDLGVSGPVMLPPQPPVFSSVAASSSSSAQHGTTAMPLSLPDNTPVPPAAAPSLLEAEQFSPRHTEPTNMSPCLDAWLAPPAKSSRPVTFVKKENSGPVTHAPPASSSSSSVRRNTRLDPVEQEEGHPANRKTVVKQEGSSSSSTSSAVKLEPAVAVSSSSLTREGRLARLESRRTHRRRAYEDRLRRAEVAHRNFHREQCQARAALVAALDAADQGANHVPDDEDEDDSSETEGSVTEADEDYVKEFRHMQVNQ